MTDSIVGKRIVTIGGGTGGFTVNRGLHSYPVYPIAICTVFDSGGSSGILRDEFGSLPQGDIRRCLIALSGDEQETVRQLFSYRFENGARPTSTLKDHSLGNLLLLAAEKTWGSVEGIRRISRLLGVHGEVLPISTDDATLCAFLNDGTIVRGETNIDLRPLDDERVIGKIWLEPGAIISREAAEAIASADVIVFGPGDLYSSIIPNLLVKGLADAIRNSKAQVVFVVNLMTKWSETRGFGAADFVKTFLSYDIGREKLDAVILNDSPIPPELIELYAKKDKSEPVLCTPQAIEELRKYAHFVGQGDLLSKNGLQQQLVRHSIKRLARSIVELPKTQA